MKATHDRRIYVTIYEKDPSTRDLTRVQEFVYRGTDYTPATVAAAYYKLHPERFARMDLYYRTHVCINGEWKPGNNARRLPHPAPEAAVEY